MKFFRFDFFIKNFPRLFNLKLKCQLLFTFFVKVFLDYSTFRKYCFLSKEKKKNEKHWSDPP